MTAAVAAVRWCIKRQCIKLRLPFDGRLLRSTLSEGNVCLKIFERIACGWQRNVKLRV